MFKVFSFIYWTSAIVALIAFSMLVIRTYYIWKKRHPDHRSSGVELSDMLQISALLILAILVPAINTCFAIHYVMNFSDITDSVLKNMEDKYYPM